MSPLKHGLFVKTPFFNFILRALNWILKGKKRASSTPLNPTKILISNIAHLGDVVIATAILPILKAKFPHTKIGFLTSSSSAVVLKNHPLVSFLHTFDHPYFSHFEARSTLAKKALYKCKTALHLLEFALGNYLPSSKKCIKSLLSEKYDIAIDLYPYFPNTIPLLYAAKLPAIIGYGTGGYSNLLTDLLYWDFVDKYAAHAHLHLLKPLKIQIPEVPLLPDYLYKTTTGNYIVIHMGSSSQRKDWDIEKWIALIQKFKNYSVYLTGKGEREAKICAEVAKRSKATNLCDKLDWFSFVKKVQEARLLISVDSASIHLAAAAQTPTIALFSDIAPIAMWAPPGCHPMNIDETASSVYEKASTLL